ncbi:MAG: hydroxymethylbilane synthase [Actinobacteria bacterium]|nr:hydroxymethylbilane synthase [Actinomycetota bacterium]
MKRLIRIGTRGSALALWQTRHVASILEKKFGCETEIVKIKTTGDKILDSPLAKIGSKGLFVKEIEVALLENRVDIAVHSAKDVPTEQPDGLIIAAFLKREDPRDALISKDGKKLSELPEGTVIGTSSLRRRAQILHFRPDLKLVDVRGNVDTRLRKMNEGQFDAIILAKAGLKRMGHESDITEVIDTSIMLPAVGQGSIAIECRESDEEVLEMLHSISDFETEVAVKAERALLRFLEGGCQVPIGAFGRIEDGELVLDAMISSLDGKKLFRGSRRGKPENAEEVGIALAEELYNAGGSEILAEIRSSAGK